MGDMRAKFEKWLMRDHQYKYYPYDVNNFKCPDWRKYKVENVPDLVNLRNSLASHGLKDPWLRNEVWRFNPTMPTTMQNAYMAIFRGWKTGFVAAVVLYGIRHTCFPDKPHDHH